MDTAARWQPAHNLLCVRLDAMGDVLMTSPALRALKLAEPRRRLTLLTSPAGAAVARLIPEIDDAIVYDAPWLKATAARDDSQPEYAMAAQLRERRFDGAAIFTVYSQNPLPAAFLCYLAGIPLRVAYCRENPYQLLTDWLPDPEPGQIIRHEVQRQLDLAAALGAYAADEHLSLRVPEAACRRVRELLATLGLAAGQPWAVVHPGSSAPSRRYPPEGFAAAVCQLVREHGWQIVLTGGPDERNLVDRVRDAAEVPVHSLAGQLDLAELAALIASAPLLVSNNSGPVHIAAALGTPVVDLYALTNPQHTPWQVPSRVLSHEVPCKYCYKSVCPEGHHDCLRRIRPEEVVAAAVELLS